MATIKKYNGSTWENAVVRKFGTATESVENPLYSDGTAITSYTIKGNTVQNGTPTPSNPVDVVGVGTLDSGQYKIPISSGGVTTNIYLTEQLMKSKDGTVNDNIASDGTVTYNLIKKVYDGSESWTKDGGDSNRTVFRRAIAGLPVVGYCTHIEWKLSYASSEYNRVIVNNNQALYISIDNSVIGGTQSSTDFTSWITNQYNNGTPFTLYYIAATPTTTQITMPSIPTTEGANSISVDTTVQPSEFTATWTGWHDANVKEWDGSQWNE